MWEGAGYWSQVCMHVCSGGYGPEDYVDDSCWDVRLLVERSIAVKCPSVAQQLVGTKKVCSRLGRGTGMGVRCTGGRCAHRPPPSYSAIDTAVTQAFPSCLRPTGPASSRGAGGAGEVRSGPRGVGGGAVRVRRSLGSGGGAGGRGRGNGDGRTRRLRT